MGSDQRCANIQRVQNNTGNVDTELSAHAQNLTFSYGSMTYQLFYSEPVFCPLYKTLVWGMMY